MISDGRDFGKVPFSFGGWYEQLHVFSSFPFINNVSPLQLYKQTSYQPGHSKTKKSWHLWASKLAYQNSLRIYAVWSVFAGRFLKNVHANGENTDHTAAAQTDLRIIFLILVVRTNHCVCWF